MYLASQETEEGAPTRVHVCYADPSKASSIPNDSVMHEIANSLDVGHDRWQSVPLGKRLVFSPRTLVKLAASTDLRSTSVLVYEFEHQLLIWALADMQDDLVRFETHDLPRDQVPDRPGLFQVHVEGVGHLSVFIGFERIAELRGGDLLPPPIDVFARGPVCSALNTISSKIYKQMLNGWIPRTLDRDQVENEVQSTLCNLLIRADRFRHGGLFSSVQNFLTKRCK